MLWLACLLTIRNQRILTVMNAVAVDEVGDDRSAGWSLGRTGQGTCSNWW
jgi:hypothetical protein